MRGRAKLQQTRRQLARRGDAPPQAHIPFSALPKVGSVPILAFRLNPNGHPSRIWYTMLAFDRKGMPLVGLSP